MLEGFPNRSGTRRHPVDSRGMLEPLDRTDGDEDRTSEIQAKSGFRSKRIPHGAHVATVWCVTCRDRRRRNPHDSARRDGRMRSARRENAREAFPRCARNDRKHRSLREKSLEK
jgi:hypothetical protein